ncbi:hypothetical protein CPB85DRAFT_1429383 [Mucidula mucida]|nr:hypothetical protein CPB85DRAFT_1429383 [Mucidula mucida]
MSSPKWVPKTLKAIMKSHRIRIPKYDMPLRLRPYFFVFTCLIMVGLALLGFTNFSRSLPLNDKILHFLCFCLATAVFYFIFDVDEDARRIWFWRHSSLLFTAFICFFCGGILSEFVQGMLPYKEFQIGDIFANLLGSSIGLYIAFHLEKYYRQRREIARLYRPIVADSPSDDEDEEDQGTQLLPTHYPTKGKPTRPTDIWDSREELFGIGDDSDDEAAAPSSTSVPNNNPIPKIQVTAS